MKTKLFTIAVLVLTLSVKAQWVSQSSGFTTAGLGINDISIVNANVAWATAFDTSGTNVVNLFTRTLNGGTTWTPGSITGATALDLTSISAYNKDTAWVSMLNNNTGGGAIYRTNNGGAMWTKQTTAAFASPSGSTDFIYMFDKNSGVCVGDSNTGSWEIYTTINGGTLWTRVTTGNIPANLIGEIGYENSYSVIGNTIWFGTSTGRVYKSVNKGATWTVSTTGLTSVTRVAFKDANNGLATDGFLLKSTSNGGTTWSTLTFTGSLYQTDLTFIPGTTGTYISTGSTSSGATTKGSSYSTNDGATWINIDAVSHSAVAFLNSTTGWSGGINTSSTVAGIYKWNGSLTTGIKNNDYLKVAETLIFPNPFSNKITIIKPNVNETQVQIYNSLGSLTYSTKIESEKTELNLTGLASGIYFVIIGSEISKIIKE